MFPSKRRICARLPLLGARAIGAVFTLPQNAMLFDGMLVVSPLTSLFKIVCLSLAFFTVFLAAIGNLAQSRRIPRADPARYRRPDVVRRK